MGIHCPRNNRDQKDNRVCPGTDDDNNIYLEYIANNKNMYMEFKDLWKTTK
jgi:hypothetical protein